MMAAMQIRDAEAAEVEALAQLWHDAWHEAHAPIVPPQLTCIRTLQDFTTRLRAALDRTRVAGPSARPDGFCIIKGDELDHLFVGAHARGSGAAAALLADAETRLAAAGVELAWLACAIGNERAARFYEKHGWRRAAVFTHRPETPDGTLSVETWRYEKRLRKAG
jgi:ribosomal protein S18 acetylase RimI-like enzyme